MPDLITDTTSIDVSRLTTFHKNPRRGDVGAIAASLTKTGQYRPIVINRGTHTGRPNEVLAGNHTLQAARSIGWTQVLGSFIDVDDDTATRIVLADNRTADLGDYNTTDLADLLQALPDIEGTGYTTDDLDAILRNNVEALPYTAEEADQAPPVPDTPTSRLGDIYQAGRHWIVCGDSTDPLFITELAAVTGKADAIWTDPPYGVDYVGGTKQKLTIQNDGAKGLPAFLEALFTTTLAIAQSGAPTYVANPDGPLNAVFYQALHDAGYDVRQGLVWVKSSLVLGRTDYHYRHEPIWYGYTPGGKGTLGRGGGQGGKKWHGDNSQTTVFEVDRPSRNEDHPTMKPVALIVAQLRNSLAPGGTVYDPCAGSGSTLIAANTLASSAIVVDLDPRYVDVMIRRFTDLTGEAVEWHSNLLDQQTLAV